MTTLQNYYQNKDYGISKSRERNILQLINGVFGKNILDIGCASGYLGKKLVSMGNNVDGVDISKDAVKEAKKVLTNAWCLDIENDVLPKRKYDLVIATEIIEHLFDPEAFMSKIRKHLSPNGKLILSTPNFLHLYNRKNFLMGKIISEGSGMFDKGHIRYFSYGLITDLIHIAGFKIIAENHVYVPNIKILPSVFAYQFVFLVC